MTNLPAPTYRYSYLNTRPQYADTSPAAARFVKIQNGGRGNRTDQNTRWLAPASGSIVRVVVAPSGQSVTAGSVNNKIADTDAPTFFVSKNNSTNAYLDSIMMHTTASSVNMKLISCVFDAGAVSLNRVVFDLENSSPVVSGSASFNPGDILNFQFFNVGRTIDDPLVTIVFKLEEEGVTYP